MKAISKPKSGRTRPVPSKGRNKIQFLYLCFACDQPIARRGKTVDFVALGGAVVERRKGEATRIKCSCGKVTVFTEGSL